ncbi:MAG: nucleoside-diphosphate kinase [Candidatus Gastranaerophilales bacterium]|nr:nucleoside-diphosphate kinase [Candidatus Gastranaerophilales bacterium]
MERTFVAIKPDGVKRGLIGKILERFENKSYKIIAMKLINVTPEVAAKHYEEHVGKPFYDKLIKFITMGPIVAMVVEGKNAIKGVRHLVGKTNPDEADDGSIRADFSSFSTLNLVHASDAVESAQREINLYFNESEICDNYKTMFEVVLDELGE